VTKTVQVTSDDPTNSSIQLRISVAPADEKQILDYQPLQVDFGTIGAGEKKKLVIELTNRDSTVSRLSVADVPDPEVISKMKIKKAKLKPGQSTKIEFQLNKEAPIGKFQTSVSLEDKEKPQSRISISILGAIFDKEAPQPKQEAKK